MKKLIIVCEEKLRHYGDFLSQLISRDDDVDEKIVGTKDGVAAAQVWTEKEYTANAVQISSEQYILFIGNSKLIKEKRTHMQKNFSKFGMNYGWLGKQAVLFVDQIVSLPEYDDFYSFLCEVHIKCNRPTPDKLVNKKYDPVEASESKTNLETDIDETTAVNDVDAEGQRRKRLVPLEPVKAGLQKAKDNGTVALNRLSNNINRIAKSRDIENQEYTCLIEYFYLNDLSNFLGLGEVRL